MRQLWKYWCCIRKCTGPQPKTIDDGHAGRSQFAENRETGARGYEEAGARWSRGLATGPNELRLSYQSKSETETVQVRLWSVMVWSSEEVHSCGTKGLKVPRIPICRWSLSQKKKLKQGMRRAYQETARTDA